ncbi:hypothetical protein F6X40_27720 [Paraburkholderia sp. UCT31]|uniref:hypothetical protein n=1 Tax=Paraburkholderia sp. UCT31 TaxID=2615209 RepID=UPI0016567036|nr:hypothetical protein [Paraburkholderia sp. UCT31]MBC8740428.1 hypothetical protein [Paraburkholderia sp. UCT31]
MFEDFEEGVPSFRRERPSVARFAAGALICTLVLAAIVSGCHYLFAPYVAPGIQAGASRVLTEVLPADVDSLRVERMLSGYSLCVAHLADEPDGADLRIPLGSDEGNEPRFTARRTDNKWTLVDADFDSVGISADTFRERVQRCANGIIIEKLARKAAQRVPADNAASWKVQ